MRVWVATAAVAALISGCGTAATAGPPHDGAQPGTTRSVGPQAGTRAEALALARELLARPFLPTGTRPAPPPSTPPGAAVIGAQLPTGSGSVELGQDLVAPGTLSAVQAYIRAHGPNGTPPAVGHAPGLHELEFTLSNPQPGIYSAYLDFSMTKLTETTTRVSEFAQVYWYPARSAAETLNAASYRSVTITATILKPRSHQVSRTFTARAVIGELTGLLNGLPATPQIEFVCAGLDVNYELRFDPDVVDTSRCTVERVVVRGVEQPSLWDTAAKISALAGRLLGVKE